MDYKSILDNFKDRHILIVGDIILDHYVWGNVDRISPEAPVPVVDVQRESYMLGGAGNVAHNIVSLGARASIAGITGHDHRAEILKEILREEGIETKGILHDRRSTTVKTRVIAHNQQVVRFDRENRNFISPNAFRSLTNYISDAINAFDGIIISDYKKGVISSRMVKYLVDLARPLNLFVSVDPKVGNFRYYKGVSMITPNVKEASEGSGVMIGNEKTLEKEGSRLLNKLSCEAVLITRGERGMSLFSAEGNYHIPTVPREVYDVTGAGDTVISAFTLSHISGGTMLQSSVIANHAGGIVVGEVGTATTTTDDILDSLNNERDETP